MKLAKKKDKIFWVPEGQEWCYRYEIAAYNEYVSKQVALGEAYIAPYLLPSGRLSYMKYDHDTLRSEVCSGVINEVKGLNLICANNISMPVGAVYNWPSDNEEP